MAYFDIDDTATTPDSEAENRRRVLAAIASSGKPAVLGQPSQPSQPNIPTPRLQPTEAPSLGTTEMFGNKPPTLGTPPILPGRPNVMPTREDFPAKSVPTWQKVLGIAAAPFLPNLTTNILGRPQREANQEYQQAVQDYTRPLGIARTQAETREINARAAALEAPKTEKPENLDREAYDYYIAQGMNPAAARKQVLADAQAEKAAPKENKAVAGTLNGKPAWGLQTDKGWVDPQTQRPIPSFAPAPTYAETGNYDPVQTALPGGGMGVGAFNRRTGTVTPVSGNQPIAIPKDAQKEIDAGLSAARDADNRYKTMTQNQADAAKGNQQAMLSLVANHIGMTLGMQRGSRITQAIWEEAIKSTPFLQGIAARFDERGYLSGVTLTPQQAQQMVELAKQKRELQWGQARQAAEQYGLGNTVKLPKDIAPPAAPAGTKFTPF